MPEALLSSPVSGFFLGLPSATTYKGSDSLRALFFLRFPGEARECAEGGAAPKTPEMAYFWRKADSVIRVACR